jgi:hypothetical protein
VASSTFDIREEVLNVLLAELLEERGLWSVPESIRYLVRGAQRRLPDITLADLWGVRIIIEGRIFENDNDSVQSVSRCFIPPRFVPEGRCRL